MHQFEELIKAKLKTQPLHENHSPKSKP